MSKLDDIQRLKANKAARFAASPPSRSASGKAGGGHVASPKFLKTVDEKKLDIGKMERGPLSGERPSAESSGSTNSKGGRPLAKDADKALSRTKPWEAEGMSRRTWYRRKGKAK